MSINRTECHCGQPVFQHGLCIECVKSPEEYAEMDRKLILKLTKEIYEFDPEWAKENL